MTPTRWILLACDQAGHIACADRGNPGMLVSCGKADLSSLSLPAAERR